MPFICSVTNVHLYSSNTNKQDWLLDADYFFPPGSHAGFREVLTVTFDS